MVFPAVRARVRLRAVGPQGSFASLRMTTNGGAFTFCCFSARLLLRKRSICEATDVPLKDKSARAIRLRCRPYSRAAAVPKSTTPSSGVILSSAAGRSEGSSWLAPQATIGQKATSLSGNASAAKRRVSPRPRIPFTSSFRLRSAAPIKFAFPRGGRGTAARGSGMGGG